MARRKRGGDRRDCRRRDLASIHRQGREPGDGAAGRHERGVAGFEELLHAGRGVVLEPRVGITTLKDMAMGVDVARDRGQAFALNRSYPGRRRIAGRR